MKIDASGYFSTVDQAGRAATSSERSGHDGWWAVETQLDTVLACAVAAERWDPLCGVLRDLPARSETRPRRDAPNKVTGTR